MHVQGSMGGLSHYARRNGRADCWVDHAENILVADRKNWAFSHSSTLPKGPYIIISSYLIYLKCLDLLSSPNVTNSHARGCNQLGLRNIFTTFTFFLERPMLPLRRHNGASARLSEMWGERKREGPLSLTALSALMRLAWSLEISPSHPVALQRTQPSCISLTSITLNWDTQYVHALGVTQSSFANFGTNL